MKWFRSNIKHGSRLALLALALQFGLSFGHFHAGAAQALLAVQPAAAHVRTFPLPSPHPTSSISPLRCLRPTTIPTIIRARAARICAVIAMASTVLFATPPVVLLPQAADFRYLVTDAEFVHLKPGRRRFPASRSPRLLTSIA